MARGTRWHAVRGLPTWYGRLDLAMKREADGTLLVELGGNLRLPRGGFVVRPPETVPFVRFTSMASRHPHSAIAKRSSTNCRRAWSSFGEPLPEETLTHPPHEA